MGSQGGYHEYPMGRIPKPPGPHETLGPHVTPGAHGPWAMGVGGGRWGGRGVSF